MVLDLSPVDLHCHRRLSRAWRDAVSNRLVGNHSTSSARYQDDVFNENACLGDGVFTSMQAIQMAALAQQVLNELNECVASSSTKTGDNTMLESLIADVAALQASTEQFNANYGITLVWCGLEGFESELRAVDAMPDDTPEAKVRKAKEVNRLRNWFNDSKQHIESARVRDLQLRLNAGRAIYGLLTELWESITDHLDPDNINALLGTDLCNRINAAITGKLPTP